MLVAKSIQDKPESGDGYRLLITSEWPAKLPGSAADGFNPALAPPPESYEALKAGKMNWEEFGRAYGEALDGQQERLARLARQAKDFTITLLSYPDVGGHKLAQPVVERCQALAEEKTG